MALHLVSGPAIEPVTVAEAKLHCKVDVTTDDALIANLIVAARQYAETFTQRAFISQTWDLKLDAFPCGVLTLPMPPVQSVTSITYLDTAGDAQAWSTALYQTDLPSGLFAAPARIAPAYGQSYPLTRSDVFNAVTVRFVCGYGASATAVPTMIREAVLLLVGWMYEQRQSTVEEGSVRTADLLLWSFKAFAYGH